MKFYASAAALMLAACTAAPSQQVSAAQAGDTAPDASAQAAPPPATAPKAKPGRDLTAELTRPPNTAPAADVKTDNLVEAENDKARKADFAEAMQLVVERQKVFDDEPRRFSLSGDTVQGGLVFGVTEPGATVRLDGANVMVGDDGRFVFGFGRDSDASALLTVTLPDGVVERHALDVADRDFPVSRIDGLDQSKVSGFTEEQLAKIAVDREKKKEARKVTQPNADWADGFEWPVIGRISGVFGSQRILNGEPKRPHSGVDVAAPTGTPIRAPAAGVIRLAEEGMYFEGGLVLLDHGHWLESAFLHMSRIDVTPGQRVEKGDVIGAVGSTGRSTGPHLHWSIKWAGRLVDAQLLVGEMPAKENTEKTGGNYPDRN